MVPEVLLNKAELLLRKVCGSVRNWRSLPGSSGPFLVAGLPGIVWRESLRCGTVTCGDVRARSNQHDWLLSSGSSARLGLLECGGGGLAEHLESESGLVPRTGRGPVSRLGPVCQDHRLEHWPFQTSALDPQRGTGRWTWTWDLSWCVGPMSLID